LALSPPFFYSFSRALSLRKWLELGKIANAPIELVEVFVGQAIADCAMPGRDPAFEFEREVIIRDIFHTVLVAAEGERAIRCGLETRRTMQVARFR
jgi:hypothetical protein